MKSVFIVLLGCMSIHGLAQSSVWNSPCPSHPASFPYNQVKHSVEEHAEAICIFYKLGLHLTKRQQRELKQEIVNVCSTPLVTATATTNLQTLEADRLHKVIANKLKQMVSSKQYDYYRQFANYPEYFFTGGFVRS